MAVKTKLHLSKLTFQGSIKKRVSDFYSLKPLILLVGVARFELATSCSQSRRDNRATLYPEKELKIKNYFEKLIPLLLTANVSIYKDFRNF